MYKLIDSGNQKKLEKVGNYIIARPSIYAVWPITSPKKWMNIDAEYVRYSGGSGDWKFHNKNMKKDFQIEFSGILFNLRFNNFGHLGVFPEQEENWKWMSSRIEKWVGEFGRQPEVLNLFAYTGGSTLACAKAGARVTHVDAVKSVVDWAHSNAFANNIPEDRIRWIVDDAVKFVRREVTRGKKYDAIILDPPSHGRGPKGETFVIEENIIDLLDDLKGLLRDNSLFFNYTCHTPGFTPQTIKNQSNSLIPPYVKNEVDEMLIKDEGGKNLPSGFVSKLFI